MKKILALTLAVVMCFLMLSACAKKKDTLVIGYTVYEPMNYTDENGELIGFDTEFAKAVCEKLGYEPVFQEINWNNKYQELNSGAIDCIWNGFTSNCADDDGTQRSEKVDFSYAYMINEQCVVIRSADSAIYTTKESLAGKTSSAENGSAGESYAKEFAGDNGKFIGKTAQKDTLTELISNTADFAVIDKTMAKTIIGKGDYSSLMIVDSIVIESEEYSIGFKKGSDLTAKVNGAIKELAADGTLARLAEKYGLSNWLITDYN